MLQEITFEVEKELQEFFFQKVKFYVIKHFVKIKAYLFLLLFLNLIK